MSWVLPLMVRGYPDTAGPFGSDHANKEARAGAPAPAGQH